MADTIVVTDGNLQNPITVNGEVNLKNVIDGSGGAAVSVGGTRNHNVLRNRDLPNQHPISAITGLQEALANVKNKIKTTAEWNADITFIPQAGELIIYSDYAQEEIDGRVVNIPNMKVGDGNAYLIDIPFMYDDVRSRLNAHIDDEIRHITAAERLFWNSKVRDTVENETLIFTMM